MSCIQKLSQLLSEISQYKIFVCLSIKKTSHRFYKIDYQISKKKQISKQICGTNKNHIAVQRNFLTLIWKGKLFIDSNQ